MSKKEKKRLKSSFEYECYLRDTPYYIMIKYGFYFVMLFTAITYLYGAICLYMEFVLHVLIVKEFTLLMLLFVICIGTVSFTVGNIVFEIKFRKQLHN
ncbi:MAG: hypothetical protein IKC45_08370 [Clostridia bacterium]|nr:hypothetical protein [Clostridia bacterium]